MTSIPESAACPRRPGRAHQFEQVGGLGPRIQQPLFGFQPNTRIMWAMTPTQRVWAAASRAVRTPSLIDRGLYVEYPLAALPAAARTQLEQSSLGMSSRAGVMPIVGVLGNPDFSNEYLVNTEAGYRLNVGSTWSVDVVGFSGRYTTICRRSNLYRPPSTSPAGRHG